MSRGYSARGREEKSVGSVGFWWDSRKEGDNWEDLDKVATIILR
jgi:hypothetical protein